MAPKCWAMASISLAAAEMSALSKAALWPENAAPQRSANQAAGMAKLLWPEECPPVPFQLSRCFRTLRSVCIETSHALYQAVRAERAVFCVAAAMQNPHETRKPRLPHDSPPPRTRLRQASGLPASAPVGASAPHARGWT